MSSAHDRETDCSTAETGDALSSPSSPPSPASPSSPSISSATLAPPPATTRQLSSPSSLRSGHSTQNASPSPSPAMDTSTRHGLRARTPHRPTSSSHSAYPTSTTAGSVPTPASSAPTSLALPNLPRFHPANFPSPSPNPSSLSTTPGSPLGLASRPISPPAPVSPRGAHRQYSEAQRALYAYQRELLGAQGARPSVSRAPSGGATSLASSGPTSPLHPYGGAPFPMMTGIAFAAGPAGKPVSPKLVPLAGSPGPVTPLELEGEMKGGGDYLSAGARRHDDAD